MPAPSYRDYKLPHGRHGLRRSEVVENQRWRLIGAASEVLAERRVTGITSRLVAHRAGVSSETFYEHFEGVDDVLIAAFANAAQLLVELVGAAHSASAEPHDACQKALSSALSLAAKEPGLGAVMRTEVAVAIPGVMNEWEQLLARLDKIGRGSEDGVGQKDSVAGAIALAIERVEVNTAGAAANLSRDLASVLGRRLKAAPT